MSTGQNHDVNLNPPAEDVEMLKRQLADLEAQNQQKMISDGSYFTNGGLHRAETEISNLKNRIKKSINGENA